MDRDARGGEGRLHVCKVPVNMDCVSDRVNNVRAEALPPTTGKHQNKVDRYTMRKRLCSVRHFSLSVCCCAARQLAAFQDYQKYIGVKGQGSGAMQERQRPIYLEPRRFEPKWLRICLYVWMFELSIFTVISNIQSTNIHNNSKHPKYKHTN